jgi:hypothetical protein
MLRNFFLVLLCVSIVLRSKKRKNALYYYYYPEAPYSAIALLLPQGAEGMRELWGASSILSWASSPHALSASLPPSLPSLHPPPPPVTNYACLGRRNAELVPQGGKERHPRSIHRHSLQKCHPQAPIQAQDAVFSNHRRAGSTDRRGRWRRRSVRVRTMPSAVRHHVTLATPPPTHTPTFFSLMCRCHEASLDHVTGVKRKLINSPSEPYHTYALSVSREEGRQDAKSSAPPRARVTERDLQRKAELQRDPTPSFDAARRETRSPRTQKRRFRCPECCGATAWTSLGRDCACHVSLLPASFAIGLSELPPRLQRWYHTQQ